MTRGSKALHPNASIYDLEPIVLFDRFPWAERESVLQALAAILPAGAPKWTFGGAYLFWGQVAAGNGGGQVLYCGEAGDLMQRMNQHLLGTAGRGNKFNDLTSYSIVHPTELCGLALLAIPPDALEWLEPPGEGPVLLDGAAKQAAEGLEGLLLRASVNLFGALPPFNDRDDASKFRHGDDVVRFQLLIRYLLDHPDGTMDFSCFRIRDERAEAAARLRREIADCEGLR